MNLCSKGGGVAIAPPAATYNQPPPAPPIPGGNLAQGVNAVVVSMNVKAEGSPAMNKDSVVMPSADLGSPGIGGTISAMIAGQMEFGSCESSNVKIERQAAARMGDTTKHNSANCRVGHWVAPSAMTVLIKG